MLFKQVTLSYKGFDFLQCGKFKFGQKSDQNIEVKLPVQA